MNAPQALPGWVLALDASTPRCAIALGTIDTEGARLIVEDNEDDDANQASTRIAGRIEQALRTAGIGAGELVTVACGRGPGTFTGTRVAVATSKGLAFGLGIPTLAISTLAAIAASVRHDGTVVAVIDARRREVYGAPFRCAWPDDGPPLIEATAPERVAPIADVLANIPDDSAPRVAGTGVEPYREALESLGHSHHALALPGPTARGLWAATVSAWHRESAQHPAALDAVYLRASYAEMGISTPKRPFVKSPFV